MNGGHCVDGIRMANPLAHRIRLLMNGIVCGGVRMANPEGGCSDNSRGLVT